MTILSTITSISRPNKISKSFVSSNGGSSISMGSNSVACYNACGGGSSYSYSSSYSGSGLDYSYKANYSSSTGNNSYVVIASSTCNCN
ncbi:hssA/2C/7E family protein [Dictyostelium discoideum AX4]|uniref:HssA/B-like protein 57 n=1 Tax=Dictyostelium discoideum TaxID=44689 RepID=HSL57_DICDI|nr:hssA/2C/7E family protein [Dictyostelium discoideum AX4]Q54SP6.1 RecName: Full=HssA/B-like protein 57 [Dictyostelium discoideum]EAL66282.1 hssA/2C/7E family protein [Dictyostelium discoideum AX4]|eukprot:XP_640255.1 hssA/2C/7E family protein [Dictyostelium discoideum AX4]